MATIKQVIGANTGAGSRATEFKKSAKASARFFEENKKGLRNKMQKAQRMAKYGRNAES